MPIPRLSLCLAASLLLIGCLPTEADGPPPRQQIGDLPYTPATPEEIAQRCGAPGVQHLIGERWPQELPRNMTTVRVFETGAPVTMDFNADRVNIELVPGSSEIARIFCG